MFAAQPAVETTLRLETLVLAGTLADVENAWRALQEAITRLLSAFSALVSGEGA